MTKTEIMQRSQFESKQNSLYTKGYWRIIKMDISRKLGILVFCAVPAIIGGGIVYAIFGTYPSVFIFEILLLFVALGIISK